MHVCDPTPGPPLCSQVLAVFNARPEPYKAAFPPDCGALQLHPALAALQASDAALAGCGVDAGQRLLQVAPRCAAVFVQPRG